MAVKMIRGQVVNISLPHTLTKQARKTLKNIRPNKTAQQQALQKTANLTVKRRKIIGL